MDRDINSIVKEINIERDVNSIFKEIDWFNFFNKINIYNIAIDLDIKTWDDFVLKFFPKLNLFDSTSLVNKQLTSLTGSPKEVSGDFICYRNQLTSLEGGPLEVHGNFECSYNQLTSLKGSPQKVDGCFGCTGNWLTSLEGAPKEVGGGLDCVLNSTLPRYKIIAYEAYLELSDSEKAPLTKDNHYYPTKEWENKFK